jgi:glycosyltransferase involved in cell wall biosynthesis
MDNHFKIIIPLYNVEKWIKICLRSVRAQTYKNFQCIIIDDLSTDSSTQVIREEIGGDDRFVLIVNKTKKLALQNIYDGINYSAPASEDVIITLDGDDWFSSKDVLEKVNNVYNSSGCWLTYGSYAEYPHNQRGNLPNKYLWKL